MTRFALNRRVFFIEEPLFGSESAALEVRKCPESGVTIVTPLLPTPEDVPILLEGLISEFLADHATISPICWFYTPMALDYFPSTINPAAVVYDCMDELSLFRGAPLRLQEREKQLLAQADLVFTGGVSLFEAKKLAHPRVYAFPSGVDVAHFRQARGLSELPRELQSIPGPRIGYAGVIDERIDLQLLDHLSQQRPLWQFVMIGPVAKIRDEDLPRRPNIHWLGMRAYSDLPVYFAGWDIGMMPFALNEATRFISPTKTPEYLSAGLPVVSTAIQDVVSPYGQLGLARIGYSAAQFEEQIDQLLLDPPNAQWLTSVDEFLAGKSWDAVWEQMDYLLCEAVGDRELRGSKSTLTSPAAFMNGGSLAHV